MSANTNALSSAPFLGSRDVHLKQCKPATTFWVGLGNKISVLVVQPELSAIPGIGEAGANQAMYGHVVQRGVS